VHSADYLAEVAAELNERPRKRFGWDSPGQVLNRATVNPIRNHCCNQTLKPPRFLRLGRTLEAVNAHSMGMLYADG
jgi:hypothetical protein